MASSKGNKVFQEIRTEWADENGKVTGVNWVQEAYFAKNYQAWYKREAREDAIKAYPIIRRLAIMQSGEVDGL